MMAPKKFSFKIVEPGDHSAGILSFTDDIEIWVGSGNPGGDESGDHSFQEYMRAVLEMWYSARVSVQ